MKPVQHDTPVALGPFLRQAREEAGLSLQRLADRIGIHKSYLGRIELGDYRQPSPEVLQKISRALGISYADLFALTGYRIPEELPSLVPYLRSRYRMSDEDTRKALAYIQRLRRHHPPHGGPQPKTPGKGDIAGEQT